MKFDERLRSECVSAARQFGATRLLLFGSAVATPESARDVDFACDGVRGWDLYRLGARLEEVLKMPVDLVPLRADDRFANYIAGNAEVLYDAARTA